jgi:hypothetical protein
MASSVTSTRPPWWQRRGPSALVFALVVIAMTIASIAMWSNLAGVLPDVGKDQQGEDPWEDPVGIEKVGVFHVAHLPDCAAAPVERIELWDEESEPYWQAVGAPTPMSSFVIGVAPEGFLDLTPYTEPPAGAVLRLVVVRSVKGVAGTRYETADLRTAYVIDGDRRYEIEDFTTGEVCGDPEEEDDDAGPTTTGTASTTTAPELGG